MVITFFSCLLKAEYEILFYVSTVIVIFIN